MTTRNIMIWTLAVGPLSQGLTANATPDWPSVPHEVSTLGWEGLSQQSGLPDYEVAASDSIIPGWKGEGLLVFKNPGTISLNLHPGANGVFDLAVGGVIGGPYVSFTVKINGVELGQLETEKAGTHLAVAVFTTPTLWSRDNVMEIIPARPGSLALLYVDPRPAEFIPVPRTLWREVTNAASSRKSLVVQLHQPDLLAAPFFRLTANAPCTLRAAGEVLMQSDGHASVLKQGKRLAALTTYELVPASDRADFSFELETTPLGGGRFLDHVPTFLDGGQVEDWPRAQISNGSVVAVVALPDAHKGFYRGPRFESAGMVVSLHGGGHEFASGNYGEIRDPVANDHISGTAEEFGDEVGFLEAKSGQPFLKVGVGLFEKPFAAKYSFAASYWPVDIFPWETEVFTNRVEFRQRAATPMGWGYDYRKRVIAGPGANELVIEHELLNTGSRRLVTTHYCHNFFLVDRCAPGLDYELEFGFTPKLLNRFALPLLEVVGRKVRPRGADTFCTALAGCVVADDNWVRIRHAPAGAAITIRESAAPFRQALYLSEYGICPESFVRIDLAPGERTAWTRTYTLEPGP